VVGPKPPCGAPSSMPERGSAKQNGRKCRAQWVSAEAAPSTEGRKEEYGDEPDSLIHCGDGGNAFQPEADGTSRREAVVKERTSRSKKNASGTTSRTSVRLRTMVVPNGCLIVFAGRRGASIRRHLVAAGKTSARRSVYRFEGKAIRSRGESPFYSDCRAGPLFGGICEGDAFEYQD